MKKNILNTLLALVALALPACTDDDTPFGSQTDPLAGQLHITSVTIDGGEVASRAVYEGEGTESYNRSVTGFTTNDRLVMVYGFTTETPNAKAQLVKTDAGWDIRDEAGNALVIRPASGEKWENFTGRILYGEEDPTELTEDLKSAYGIVQGSVSTDNNYLFKDRLTASGNAVTVNTDLNSPTLGAMKIKLSHVHSLLQLDKENVKIEGSFLVDGKEYTNASLATLWAVRSENSETDASVTHYVPLTSVTINGKEYLQAIIRQGSLTGFKAVMKSVEGENVEYFTLGLPFKVGTSATSAYTLQPNYRYPLTLTITPTTASVTLTNTGKPGWGNDEIMLEQAYDVVYVTYEEMAARATTSAAKADVGGTFEIYTPAGLRMVCQWMNDETNTGNGITDINKYNPADFGKTDTRRFRLSQNITLKKDLTFGADDEAVAAIAGDNFMAYTGVFDGNNKTITGMKVTSTAENAGFIGQLGENGANGIFKNLTLKDCSVTTTCAGFADAGVTLGVAAGFISDGEITNVHVTGNSTALTASAATSLSVGALAGEMNANVVCRDCSNLAGFALSATSAMTSITMGGLVGYNSAVILQSLNSGVLPTVTVTESSIGSLVGYNNGKLVACANTTESSHDLVGSTGDSNAACYGCYSIGTGTLEAKDNGSFKGTETDVKTKVDDMNKAILDYNTTIGPNYILSEQATEGWDTGLKHTDITGVTITTSVEYAEGTFKVYDADGLVKVNAWMMGDGTAPTDGLDNVDKMSQNITLMRDIDLTGKTWIPLGTRDAPYSGTIIGNMYTLSGLTINNVTSDYVGLVGYLQDGCVRNLYFNAPNVSGKDYVGVVAGYNDGGRIFTCDVTNATVSGTNQVGGIVGANYHNNEDYENDENANEVARCMMNGGTVTGTTNVGSIVGHNMTLIIENENDNVEYKGFVVACGSTATTQIPLVGKNEGDVRASWYWNENATADYKLSETGYTSCYAFPSPAVANYRVKEVQVLTKEGDYYKDEDGTYVYEGEEGIETDEAGNLISITRYYYPYIKDMVQIAFNYNSYVSWVVGRDPQNEWPTLDKQTPTNYSFPLL